MDSDQLPSWGPEPERARVKAARGAVREALGGLRNVEQLLGSLRVGPRALAGVVPDVAAALSPVPGAFSDLAALISSQLPQADSALKALTAESLPPFESLAAELDMAAGRPMNARNRLLLQSLVSQRASILASACDLLDMLGNVAWSRRDSISLLQVLNDTFRDSRPSGLATEAAMVGISMGIGDVEVVSSASILASVLVHGVRWLLRLDPKSTPRISMARSEQGVPALIIDTSSESRQTVRWMVGRQTLTCVGACLTAVADSPSCQLELDTSAQRVTLLVEPVLAPPK